MVILKVSHKRILGLILALLTLPVFAIRTVETPIYSRRLVLGINSPAAGMTGYVSMYLIVAIKNISPAGSNRTQSGNIYLSSTSSSYAAMSNGTVAAGYNFYMCSAGTSGPSFPPSGPNTMTTDLMGSWSLPAQRAGLYIVGTTFKLQIPNTLPLPTSADFNFHPSIIITVDQHQGAVQASIIPSFDTLAGTSRFCYMSSNGTSTMGFNAVGNAELTGVPLAINGGKPF